jgi:hypothetical protein
MLRIAGVEVYAPTGAIDTAPRVLAPRRASLAGARIGILDNHKEFSNHVLDGVARQLRDAHGVEIIRVWRKNYLGRASPYGAEMAAQCDAVINGVGH